MYRLCPIDKDSIDAVIRVDVVVIVVVWQYPARRLQCIAWIRAVRGLGTFPVVCPTGGRLVLPDITDDWSDGLQGGIKRRPHLWGQVALVEGVSRVGLPGPIFRSPLPEGAISSL